MPASGMELCAARNSMSGRLYLPGKVVENACSLLIHLLKDEVDAC